MDFRDEKHVGQHVYGINAKTDQNAEYEAPAVALEFTGAADDGRVVAEGNLLISVDALGDSTAFLGQALEGIGVFCGARPRSRAGPGGRGRAPNSGQRWDSASLGELRRRWMGSSPPTTSAVLTGELAEAFGRSRTSIRAQLARLGCDPDVPGRPLVDVPVEEAVPAEGDREEAVTVAQWEFHRA